MRIVSHGGDACRGLERILKTLVFMFGVDDDVVVVGGGGDGGCGGQLLKWLHNSI